MIDKDEDRAIAEARVNALRLFNELRELPYRDQAWFNSFLRRVDPDWWLPECFTAWPFTSEHKFFRPRDVPAKRLEGRLFHISKDRWERIGSQGWKLPSSLSAKESNDDLVANLLADPTLSVYHFLDGDKAECSVCGKLVEGLIAETPAELQTAKMLVEDTR